MGLFDLMEQNLCDQARAIQKNELLSEFEIEVIKMRVLEPVQEMVGEKATA